MYKKYYDNVGNEKRFARLKKNFDWYFFLVYLEEECCVGGPHLHPVGLHEEVPQAQDSRANKQVNKRYKDCSTDYIRTDNILKVPRHLKLND